MTSDRTSPSMPMRPPRSPRAADGSMDTAGRGVRRAIPKLPAQYVAVGVPRHISRTRRAGTDAAMAGRAPELLVPRRMVEEGQRVPGGGQDVSASSDGDRAAHRISPV